MLFELNIGEMKQVSAFLEQRTLESRLLSVIVSYWLIVVFGFGECLICSHRLLSDFGR